MRSHRRYHFGLVVPLAAGLAWTHDAAGSRRAYDSFPQVRLGTAVVTGQLSGEIVRRFVRRNFGRIRQCYEQGIAQNPRLAGRVAIRFVIGPDGSVTESRVASTTLREPMVPGCIASVFLALHFPAPAAGTVTVTYPMQLEPPVQY